MWLKEPTADGAGEMTQCLKAPAALAEDQTSINSTHTGTHNGL